MGTRKRIATGLSGSLGLRVALLLLGLVWGLWGSPLAAADPLDKELLKQAPEIIKALKARGYKNVGVLKFRARKGTGPVSDNIGPLNLTIANRLEIALVLGNDNDDDPQVGIIKNASTVAARVKGANHLTVPGRKVLLEGSYPLAWGRQQVTPDAFITGMVQVGEDLEEMTVHLLVFDRKSTKLEKLIPAFTIATDAFDLIDAGESFTLRGAFDRTTRDKEPIVTAQEVAKAAVKVKDQEATYPLQESAAPIALEVFYDQQPVSFELKGGKALIAEPREGQKVVFVLKRKAPGSERLGVVLLVNGENVLFKQRVPAVQARKFVFAANTKPITVQGFRINNKEVQRFRVLSLRESKKAEINYGADVGTITLVVFREKQKGQESGVLPGDDAEDLAAIRGGVFPNQTPANLGALKAQLRADPLRGLIGQGEVVRQTSNEVSFRPDPTPIMTATLTYYKPSR